MVDSSSGEVGEGAPAPETKSKPWKTPGGDSADSCEEKGSNPNQSTRCGGGGKREEDEATYQGGSGGGKEGRG